VTNSLDFPKEKIIFHENFIKKASKLQKKKKLTIFDEIPLNDRPKNHSV
jgi:hypothetical protein